MSASAWYQFRLTPLGEHSTGAREVMVSGDPAPHVEPLGRPSGWRAVLSVQQHQLLLSPDCTALQHLLQLQKEEVNIRSPPGSFPYCEPPGSREDCTNGGAASHSVLDICIPVAIHMNASGSKTDEWSLSCDLNSFHM